MQQGRVGLNRHRQPTVEPAGCRATRSRAWSDAARLLVIGLLSLLLTSQSFAQVELPTETSPAISIAAREGYHWTQGSYDVWLVKDCQLRQGRTTARAKEAVLWITQPTPTRDRPQTVIAYFEGEVLVDQATTGGKAKLSDASWLGRFTTNMSVDVKVPAEAARPDTLPPIYQRAVARRQPTTDGVVQAQFTTPAWTTPAATVQPTASRRIRAFPRSDVPVQAQWFPDPATNQWIAVIDSGINLIVDGLQNFGSLDVSADRVVIWTTSTQEPDLTGQNLQMENQPLELYLEGNIVFRQGSRVVYADRMYYDVRNHQGTVIHAEVLSPVPKFEGLVRLRAEVLQQVSQDRFFAQNSLITSSRIGEPSYRLQAGDVMYEDLQRPAIEPSSGMPLVDPQTGAPLTDNRREVSGRNAMLFLGPLPVFYWPYFATDVTDPTLYVRRVRLKNDNVFGTQVLTDFNMYQLLGIRKKPEGTDWDVSFDYMSQRGFGHGTEFEYNRDDFFGIPGSAGGLLDFWGIYDTGIDNLGGDRSAVPLEKNYRYRLFGRHRQYLDDGFQATAELGFISDRNFVEEYFKREWEDQKDFNTGVELKRLIGNRSWAISADYRLNDFVTQTDWLPRFDHFWIGQSLLNDTFTWYEHSQAAYAQMELASQPTNPVDRAKFGYQPWEGLSGHAGERLISRQEIDWPFQLGPVKLVPYALGEAGDWGEDLSGQRVQRLYGQAGIRASMPMWALYPDVESTLWNIHGVAHKITFRTDCSFSDANRDLNTLPLYDPLDDDNIEAFRRRFAFNTFGQPIVAPGDPAPLLTAVPGQLDPRSYALRSGMGGWVTSPSSEIADDLLALRFGVEQRWQTKRGPPGQQHILDWIALDVHATAFPDSARDNYGRAVGLLDYEFRWFVGDRLTITSDGAMDVFPQAGSVFNVGAFLLRPPRGSLYLGMTVLSGPVDSQVLSASYSYWMSPKWVSTAGMSIDLTGRNIGQNLTVTRVGESFLVSAGFNIDATRGSVGANFMIEPRFLPKGRLGSVGGAHIPPAGAYGLE